MIELSLPYPPSANALWRAVNGRNIESAEYRDWKRGVAAHIAMQRPQRLSGPYRMTMTAERPDRRRRDLANLEKAVSDSLVAAGVIEDDCLAKAITLQWAEGEPCKSPLVHVQIEAAS